jgi:cyclophilin family peptidyl-prolyl cis-trans isomerase
MAQLEKDYPNDFLFVYRSFPLLSIHDKAALATQAAEAAGRQSKFWEMHDLLFAQQSAWSGLSVEQFESWLQDQVKKLGLDVNKFTTDLKSPELVQFAQDASTNAQKLQVTGTPFLLVNDQIWPSNMSLSYDNLVLVIKMYLLEHRKFTYCPPMTIDTSKTYFATLHTAKGDIVIELYADKAPMTVNSFVFLAKQGWFNGITFHRVIQNFVAQTGDPSGTGYGGPGYAFSNEISDLKFDKAGVVAMANAGGDNSNGSQFFITFVPAVQLDGRYTIFGQVIEGMDVAQKLSPRDPDSGGANLPAGDAILSVDIEEK